MKLLHIGDLHLGKSLGEFDLSEDQKYILDQILKIAEESINGFHQLRSFWKDSRIF